jgi:hypothetical protein
MPVAPRLVLRGNQVCLGRAFGLDKGRRAINVNVGDALHETSLFVIQARRLDVAHHNFSTARDRGICFAVRNRHPI